jgi:hypothetical protein
VEVIAVEVFDKPGAVQKVADKMKEMEAAFITAGASEVWFVHWGELAVLIPSVALQGRLCYSTGVFLGMKEQSCKS